jgi:hypothetical protein
VAAVVNEGPTRRSFHGANGWILLFDFLERSPDVIDHHAEVIQSTRIPGSALVESDTDVSVACYDCSSKGTRNAPRCQYPMTGCLGTVALRGWIACSRPEIE